jgi:hypothetical protein
MTLRNGIPGFGELPPQSDKEAMKKFGKLGLVDAWEYFEPYLKATWAAVRCPDDEDTDTFALELFRGENDVPTLELMRENPEEQLAVIAASYKRLWFKLMELRAVMEHARLFYALSPGHIETPHARTGELERVARPPEALQDEAGRWYNLIVEHLRGYAERLEQRTHMLWREREDAMQTRQQREDLMVVCCPPHVPKDEYQHVLLYVCCEAHKKGYCRHGENCYKEKVLQVEVDSGKRDQNGQPKMEVQMYRTCAWVQVEEQREFVYRVCDRRYSELMWSKLHSCGSARFMDRLLQYFASGDDPEFPRLDRKKMRGVYSFSNGVYVARTDTFYPYGSVPLGTTSCKYIDGPMPLDGEDIPAARLAGQDALADMAWMQIPTPFLQQILTAQELEEDVCCWLYVFLGRMLYAINDKDRWQIMLFIKGVAGSGKSTLGMLVKMFYDPSDVGILSNNAQKQFALADLYEKLVVLCFEVKHNFRLDQAELQSMISGEEVSVARKHKQAVTTEWDVPSLFMGNEVGPWINSSNSISRRMAVLKFDHKPADSDPDLLAKLRGELPSILLKVNQAYLAAIELYGKRDIWDAMPEYFRQTQTAMKESTNPFVSYLNCCSDLLWGEEFMVPLDAISKHFRNFCRQGGWPAESSKWTEELYKQAFEEHVPQIGIQKVDECQVEGRTMRDVTVAVGFKIDDSFM